MRFFLASETIAELGRVVMLAPPNHGSEAVDALSGFPGFELVNGPAGYQLGTGERSVPRRLGPADFEVGVIAGDRTINLVLSSYLPNPDDGKVSVASARLEGMSDFLVVHEATNALKLREKTNPLEYLVRASSPSATAPDESPQSDP